MPSDASSQLRAIAVKLKAAGDGDIRLAMTRGLRSGAAPLIPLVKASAMAKLPRAGGLNAQVAGQRVTVSVRTSAATAGVRLTTTAPDTAMTDAGYVRHPLPRNRRGKGQWITQQIPAAKGWWSGTLAKSDAVVTAVLLKFLAALNDAIQDA